MQKQIGFFAFFMLVIIAAFILVWYLLSLKTINLNRDFESNAFRFSYPDDWSYQVPQPNILFLASPEVQRQEAGATISIQRSLRLSAEADNIEAALNIYLERGPLRWDRVWRVVEAATPVIFDEREALRVIIEGAEVAGTREMHSEITIAAADNGIFFIFTVTAPLDQWERMQASFEAILASVEILE